MVLTTPTAIKYGANILKCNKVAFQYQQYFGLSKYLQR